MLNINYTSIKKNATEDIVCLGSSDIYPAEAIKLRQNMIKYYKAS